MKYFKDEQCASRILDAKTPAKAKAIAYEIKDFDEAMWIPVAKQAMLTSCSMKFSQNHELAQRLCGLQGMIVECNPKDISFLVGCQSRTPTSGIQPHGREKMYWVKSCV